MNRLQRIAGSALAALVVAGSLSAPATTALAAEEDDTGRPTFSRIMVLVLENQSYEDLIGNRDAPFINDVLEREHASATRFFSPFHNSPSDYFALSSGFGYAKGDGGDWGGTCLPSPECSTDDVSVFQQLNEAGKRWRTYSEDQQTPCQIRNSGKYWVGHNPAVFFRNLGPNDYTDSGNGSCLKDNVGWEELPADIAAGTVPELSFLIPNNCNNMHDECKPLSHRIRQGDAWLESVLAGDAVVDGGLIPWVQQNDTLLVITEDEGGFTDHAYCCPYSPEGGGGHIATWVIGPPDKVKADGYQSDIDYSLYSILRMVQTNFRLPLLGHAADDVTADMSDFFPSRIRLGRGADVAGARTTLSGVDFSPNEQVVVRWDCDQPGCDGPRLADVKADASGTFEAEITIPRGAKVGSHRIGADGETSGRFGVSSFTVRAPITANPTATFRGGPMDVEGAGFRAGEEVRVSLACEAGGCAPIPLGQALANDQGAFAPTTLTVPAETRNGKYRLQATGAASGRTNEMVVWIVEGITLEPASGPTGTTVVLRGRGYVPGSSVDIVWDCRRASCPSTTTLGSVDVDAGGDFRVRVDVPEDVAEGNVAIGAAGSGTTDFARAWFKVKAPLALWPTAAPPGRTLALSGAGFGRNEQVEIRWDCEAPGCEQPVIATGDTSELGELSAVEVVVPDGIPGGTYVVGGIGLSSGVFATSTFTVTSRVTLSPSKGAAGWNVTLDGAGFTPGEPLTLRWTCPEDACPPTEPVTASADDSGRLSGLKLRVPADSAVGPRILTVAAADGAPIELPYQVLSEAEAGVVPGASTGPATRRDTGPTVGSLGSFLAPALVIGLLLVALLLLPGIRSRNRTPQGGSEPPAA